MNEPTTIRKPNGDPYISIIPDGGIIKIQLHQYDSESGNKYFVCLDKQCIPELIDALNGVKDE